MGCEIMYFVVNRNKKYSYFALGFFLKSGRIAPKCGSLDGTSADAILHALLMGPFQEVRKRTQPSARQYLQRSIRWVRGVQI